MQNFYKDFLHFLYCSKSIVVVIVVVVVVVVV